MKHLIVASLIALLACHGYAGVPETGSDPCERVLAEFLYRPQPHAALVKAAVYRAHGMTWESATQKSYDFHPENSTLRQVVSLKRNILTEYSAETSTYFPARFSVFSIKYFTRELDDRLGIPDDGYLFSMSIPDRDMQQFRGFNYPHLQDAFSYIRFFVRGTDLVVVEIQSELYRQARKLGVDPIYKHWSRQMFLAFEDYAKKTYFRLHPNGRIIIAGPDYQLRRWRSASNALSPDLTRLLYRDLPKRYGYREVEVPWAIENPGHLSSDDEVARLKPEPIEKGYAISLEQLLAASHADRRAFSVRDTGGMNAQYIDNLQHLLKRQNFTSDRKGKIELVDEHADSVVVPYTSLPAEFLYQGDETLAQTHQNVLKTLPSWVGNFKSQTVISLATASTQNTVETTTRINGHNFSYQQWVNSDRHPLIFPATTPGQVLNFKGAGRRSLQDREGLSDQSFAIKKTNTPSHRIWGGLVESEGLTEFSNHLFLLKLGSESGFRPSIATPIDVGWMEMIPRRRGAETQLVPMNSFLATDLANAPERIVQFRSYTQSPYRVLVIPQLLDAAGFYPIFKQVMESLYATYGEQLNWFEPNESFLGSDGEIDKIAALEYVHKIYLMNHDAAERILAEFTKRTLQTIGFVHGMDGHLGGTASELFDGEDGQILQRREPLGAPTGGSTNLRNVTLAGELRDLDGNVHIPGAPRSMWGKESEILKYNLSHFQSQDLRHWQETYYQMKTLLRGKTGVPPGTELPLFAFGDPKYSTTLILRRFEISEEGRLRSEYLDRDLEENTVLNSGGNGKSMAYFFKDQKLSAIYLGAALIQGRAMLYQDEVLRGPNLNEQ